MPQFGVMLPVGTKSELTQDIGPPHAQWNRLRDIALHAERLGFRSVHVPDHVQNTPVSTNSSVFECWTTIAALAEATSSIRLGQLVNCVSYRNPALLAKITSNIDVISDGRLDWVAGAGWFEPEYHSYGWTYPRPGDRIEALRDTLEIVTAMWRDDEATYSGKFHSIERAHCDPKPVQNPHPPIWVGGHGPRLMATAARYADRVVTGGSPTLYASKMELLEDGCQAVNRPSSTISRTWSGECLLAEDEDEVRHDYEARKQAAIDAGVGQDSAEAWKKLFDDSFEAWFDKFLGGTPKQVIDKLRAYEELDADYFVLSFADFPDVTGMERFASEVMPSFA